MTHVGPNLKNMHNSGLPPWTRSKQDALHAESGFVASGSRQQIVDSRPKYAGRGDARVRLKQVLRVEFANLYIEPTRVFPGFLFSSHPPSCRHPFLRQQPVSQDYNLSETSLNRVTINNGPFTTFLANRPTASFQTRIFKGWWCSTGRPSPVIVFSSGISNSGRWQRR